MNHKQKIKLARKMSGNKLRSGFFLTDAWDKRREGIAKGVKNRIKRIKKAVEAKKKKQLQINKRK